MEIGLSKQGFSWWRLEDCIWSRETSLIAVAVIQAGDDKVLNWCSGNGEKGLCLKNRVDSTCDLLLGKGKGEYVKK